LSKKEKTAATKKPAAAIVTTIIEALEELKAVDITIMDLREIYEASADFFIICNGTSSTHIGGLADRVQKNVWEELGERPLHIEGKQGRHWLLIDYFNVVVHIFDKEKREFYDVEHLWSDAKIQKI
jgi:ribosome-associated protein